MLQYDYIEGGYVDYIIFQKLMSLKCFLYSRLYPSTRTIDWNGPVIFSKMKQITNYRHRKQEIIP